jgi:hypothetical protein
VRDRERKRPLGRPETVHDYVEIELSGTGEGQHFLRLPINIPLKANKKINCCVYKSPVRDLIFCFNRSNLDIIAFFDSQMIS